MIRNNPPQRFFDNHTLYCDSGVATESQVSECIKEAIKKSEEILKCETNCKFKVNLIVNKVGEYHGFGYIRISEPQIYWMLLGRNPDGSERFEEYPDPKWVPPVKNEEKDKKTWAELAEEEESFIQPMIKKILPPLIEIPGYEYDEEQIDHLKELEGKNKEIPKMGFFEISRGYATEPEKGRIKNRLCAVNVPDWIPIEIFKMIFSPYVSKNKENYPKIEFLDSKKKGKMVFVTFEKNTEDALFALLMTKKTRLMNPNNQEQKTTLIFMHAFDRKNDRKRKE